MEDDAMDGGASVSAETDGEEDTATKVGGGGGGR